MNFRRESKGSFLRAKPQRKALFSPQAPALKGRFSSEQSDEQTLTAGWTVPDDRLRDRKAKDQDNHSLSAAEGTLQGLHYQLAPKAQTKLFRVTREPSST